MALPASKPEGETIDAADAEFKDKSILVIEVTGEDGTVVRSKLEMDAGYGQTVFSSVEIASRTFNEFLKVGFQSPAYLRFLEEEYPDKIDDNIKIHFLTMQDALQRMSRLITSLLDFGRLGKGRQLISTVTFDVLKYVIKDLDALIKNRQAVIEICGNWPILYTYEAQLAQLFQNLISNALKFVREGVRPRIFIGVEEHDGLYEFYVSDNGIGIAEKHFQNIFHLFQRLNDQSDFEGYGIGLANCKKIAEMHGGWIWVTSEVNKGSTFSFSILNLKMKGIINSILLIDDNKINNFFH